MNTIKRSRLNKTNKYRDIFNIQKELKEYKRLCTGSKKSECHTYNNWKKRIKNLINMINDKYGKEAVDDFKHLLISSKRIEDGSDVLLRQIIVAVISFMFGKMGFTHTVSISEDESVKVTTEGFTGEGWIAFVSIVVAITVIMLCITISSKRECCFYTDVVEIIEEMQKGEEEKNDKAHCNVQAERG